MAWPNIAGTWLFYGQPVHDGQTGSGQIDMTIRQSGTDLTGRLVQRIDPWTQAPPADPEATRASIVGRLYVCDTPQQATLVELVRINDTTEFKAIFTGILSSDGREVAGHVVNSRGAHGSFVMRRPEA